MNEVNAARIDKVVVLDEKIARVEVLIPKGSIEIDFTGAAKISTPDGVRYENLIEPVKYDARTGMNIYEPSRTEKISQYCMLLFESNKCGHKVDAEIDEALKAFKDEAGI
ncbi:hypothetical protein KIH86_24000 [Paenibacillus sp. HN-1]|uniref:hypothetical protein n=1 Tax=Paenibacillus TaxID=44249 RepID=UPI001CA9C9E7|nr:MULTISPECIES: hypothetical protein [Paenibacillus]MBY9081215.1 hypothetical protein [Paenibacillus sp. CGMCC 1.18879]MBY9087252.1 hypothetical protein [Paenibacillus sinensis]